MGDVSPYRDDKRSEKMHKTSDFRVGDIVAYTTKHIAEYRGEGVVVDTDHEFVYVEDKRDRRGGWLPNGLKLIDRMRGRKIESAQKAESGQKYDAGKPPAWRGLATYFPRALLAVAEVSGFGYEKYKEWNGWRKVANGDQRYADALLRHTLARASGETFDPESKLRHAAQAAWNALAVLELELNATEKVNDASK